MRYEPIIGLEVHAQLLTESKAFCNCNAKLADKPNSNTCPVCLGDADALPTFNEKVLEMALTAAMALGCDISKAVSFSRKYYTYHDLPKGYQITQHENPIGKNGYLEIQLGEHTFKKIGIDRLHIEEDTGKTIYGKDGSIAVDHNRAGVALIEIVSLPEISSASEAYAYLKSLKQLLQKINVCSGNMEDGALRCDANISLRAVGEIAFGTKVEVKNLNSFRNIERALNYEIKRQEAILLAGGEVRQETRAWDEQAKVTATLRSKELPHNYRYSPEPNIPTIFIGNELIEKVRASMPELPLACKLRLIKEYNLTDYDADVLTDDFAVAELFEQTAKLIKPKSAEAFKNIANLITTELFRLIKAKKITASKANPQYIAEIIDMISLSKISKSQAKAILSESIEKNISPIEIIGSDNSLENYDLSSLDAIISDILASNKDAVSKYKNGKTNVFGFLVAQAMGKTKANPKLIADLLKSKLN